jgi:hypothetical protein
MKHGRKSKRRSSKKTLSENFRRFWMLRGGASGFERWRQTGFIPEVLVSVDAPHFNAGFVITDRVIRCAPILRKHLMGKTESEARAIIKRNGWTAVVVRCNTAALPPATRPGSGKPAKGTRRRG